MPSCPASGSCCRSRGLGRARILEEAARPGEYLHCADLVHTQSRQKGTDLISERPGHGPGAGAFQHRTDPREREHETFAREVAVWLNDGVAAGRCAGIVLVASNPFLGQLLGLLSAPAQQALLRTVAHDYTSCRDDELPERLAQPR